MSQKFFKSVSFLIAIVLLFAPLQSAAADLIDDGTPYKLIVHNRVSATDSTPIVGAEYEVFRISTMNDDGTTTPVDPQVSLGKFTIDATGENGFQTSVKGQYRVVPTKRAPGYLLGSEFTVEFPRMKCTPPDNPTNCVVAPDDEQVLTVYPKIVKLLGSVELLKWSNNGSIPPADPTPLPGAVFKLWQDTQVPTDTTKTYPYDMGEFTTGTDGKITVENLPEGTYRFCEVTPPTGYGPIPADPCKPFTITAPDNATTNPERVLVNYQNYPLPEIVKTVNGNADGAGDELNIGEEFFYTFTFPIPENVANFNYYRVIDTFPEEVDYVGPYTVTPIGLVDETNSGYDAPSRTLTVNFDIAALAAAYAAGEREISINVPVKLNENAEGGVEIVNTVYLRWDDKTDDPNNPPGEDDDPEPVLPTEGGFDITKRDSTGNPLAGVGFQLFTDAVATIPFISPVTGQPVIEKSGADGMVHFTRLPYGTYYVKEVYVPEGYRISETITTITIPVDAGFELTITNYRIDEELPGTGTLGAVIFLGAGVLLIGAGIIFFAKRKKNDNI